MKFYDLVRDSPDSKLSSSRVWFNIANLAATAAYCYVCFNVARSPTIDLEGLAWYTLVYMGVVTSNKFANKFLSAKYSSNNSEPEEYRPKRRAHREETGEEPDNANY